MRLLQLAVLLVACAAIAACMVPPASRRASALIDMASIRAAADVEYARGLERQRALGWIDPQPSGSRVQAVFSRLVAAIEPDSTGLRWEAHVTSDPSTTAFCMSGGKLLVGNDYVKRLRLNDSELAMLLAHEMAHAIAGHVRQREDAQPSTDPADEVRAAQVAIGQEMEADEIGMRLALRAGWSREELLGFFDKLAQEEPAGTFNSTHPSASQRAARMRGGASDATR